MLSMFVQYGNKLSFVYRLLNHKVRQTSYTQPGPGNIQKSR